MVPNINKDHILPLGIEFFAKTVFLLCWAHLCSNLHGHRSFIAAQGLARSSVTQGFRARVYDLNRLELLASNRSKPKASPLLQLEKLNNHKLAHRVYGYSLNFPNTKRMA